MKQFKLQHMVDQYRLVSMRLVKPVVLVDMDGVPRQNGPNRPERVCLTWT